MKSMETEPPRGCCRQKYKKIPAENFKDIRGTIGLAAPSEREMGDFAIPSERERILMRLPSTSTGTENYTSANLSQFGRKIPSIDYECENGSTNMKREQLKSRLCYEDEARERLTLIITAKNDFNSNCYFFSICPA